jgi:hypothetical protein
MKCLQVRDRAGRDLTAHLRKDIEVPRVAGGVSKSSLKLVVEMAA